MTSIALRPGPVASIVRSARCAYIRWRIREAEKDKARLARQIELDRLQVEQFTSAIEAMRVHQAQVESGT